MTNETLFSLEEALETIKQIMSDDGLAGVSKCDIKVRLTPTNDVFYTVGIYDADGKNPKFVSSEAEVDEFYDYLMQEEVEN